jgi:microcystin-dependent protein
MPIKINNKTSVNQISLGEIIIVESNGEGTESVSIKAPSLTTSLNLVLPNSNGTSGQLLSTDGSGNLSWKSDSTAGVSSITSGTGISVDKTTGAVTVTNSAPDQTVKINSGTGISATGTYPDFTVSSLITQFTVSDARNSISSTATGLTYTSGTGVFSLTAGYSIPTSTSQTNWDTAYTNRITSLTTTGSGAATLVSNVLNIPTPSAATFTSLTVTGNSGSSTLSSGVLNVPTYTLAGLGGIKLTDLSSTATGLTYTNTTGVFSLTAGYSIPTTSSQTTWDSAYTQRLQWDGGNTNLVASTGRTSLGATTIGSNILTLVNPSAVTFPRFNADNTVSALDAATFRTAIGAGTSSTSGTVTSVAALTLGTTGTDVSSTVATGTTTPVITLNIPTASATNRGALSSSDFTNFNTAYTNRITSLTVTGSSGAATLTSNTLNIPTYTLAGLGGIKLTDLSSTATGLTYTNTTGAFSFTAGYSIPTTSSQTNWDSAFTQRLQWDGGATNLVAATGRTSLGATTVGSNLFTLTNPSAITFPRFNADNTVSSLDAATFRTAIGAGTSSTTGTVTSIATTSPITGGTITGTGTIGINASSANTASFVVQRDASGNFSAGTITATLSGNASTATSATSATSATTSTNIAGGGAGQVPYNTGSGATSFLAAGTAGQVLQSNGTAAPSWVSSSSIFPSASMQMFAGAITQTVSSGVVTTTAPTGWLLANGNAVSRTTYSALWTALGTTSSPYGQGDGSTTFNLPDMRSRTAIGVGQASGLSNRTLGGTVGTESETLTSSQIPAHTHPNTVGSTAGGTNNITSGMSANTVHNHSVDRAAWTNNGSNPYTFTGGASNIALQNIGINNSASLDHSHNIFITNNNNTGGGGSHNNMQPSIGLNYIIKT